MSIEGEAKSLMNNEAFVAALDAARKQAIASAMMCAIDDDNGRRRYLDAARVVDKVAGHLNALIIASKTGETVKAPDFYEERASSFLGRILNK